MRQSKIKRVVVHSAGVDRAALAECVSVYHAEVVERRLRESGLPLDAQIEVISGIVFNLQEQERGKANVQQY